MGCEHCENGEKKSHHTEKTKKDIITRLNRIEGQVRGVKAMVEKDTYCDEVLNQIASIQASLNSTTKLLLEKHMKSCVKEGILNGEEDVLDEVLKTIHRLMK